MYGSIYNENKPRIYSEKNPTHIRFSTCIILKQFSAIVRVALSITTVINSHE